MSFYTLKKKYKTVDKIESLYYNFKYGIDNFVYFGKAIWKFRTWDYSFFLMVIIKMAKKMAHDFENQSNQSSRGRKITRQLKSLAFLCERLYNDGYFDAAGYRPGMSSAKIKRVFAHGDYMAKQDIEYIGKILKDVRTWWE